MPEGYFDSIRPKLPNLLVRKDITTFFGHLISPHYLANFDSMKKGPARCYIGRKVVYKCDDFIAWLESRMKNNSDN